MLGRENKVLAVIPSVVVKLDQEEGVTQVRPFRDGRVNTSTLEKIVRPITITGLTGIKGSGLL